MESPLTAMIQAVSACIEKAGRNYKILKVECRVSHKAFDDVFDVLEKAEQQLQSMQVIYTDISLLKTPADLLLNAVGDTTEVLNSCCSLQKLNAFVSSESYLTKLNQAREGISEAIRILYGYMQVCLGKGKLQTDFHDHFTKAQESLRLVGDKIARSTFEGGKQMICEELEKGNRDLLYERVVQRLQEKQLVIDEQDFHEQVLKLQRPELPRIWQLFVDRELTYRCIPRNVRNTCPQAVAVASPMALSSPTGYPSNEARWEEIEALFFGMGKTKIDKMKGIAMLEDMGDQPIALSWLALVFDKDTNTFGTVFNDEQRSKRLWAKALRCGLLQEVASSDNKRVTYTLGFLHLIGRGRRSVCLSEAFQCFKRSASNLYAPAQYMVGYMYSEASGVLQDDVKAVQYMQYAARQHYARAQHHLGHMYEAGYGVLPNITKAVEYYHLAADQNSTASQCSLGTIYYKGIGVPKDYNTAVEHYQRAADQRNATACYNLGRMYELGRGVEKNYDEAVKYYTYAKEQNNANAQYRLAQMYFEGRGVCKDEYKTVTYYQYAADQNHSHAQVELGYLYEEGRLVDQDFHKAFECYQSAADEGNSAKAQCYLARMYEAGLGVRQDYDKAAEYSQRATNRGNARAKSNLAWLHEKGLGVRQDDERAVELYQDAAHQGITFAQWQLSRRYASGRGVPKDMATARQYFKLVAAKAVRHKVAEVKFRCRTFASKLSPRRLQLRRLAVGGGFLAAALIVVL